MGYNEEDQRLFYNIKVDDIRYTKEQQWKTVYFTVIANAAIISLALYLGLHDKCESQFSQAILLTLISCFISCIGIIFLWNYQFRLEEYRARKENLEDELKNRLNVDLKNKIKPYERKIKCGPLRCLSRNYFSIVFTLVIILSFLILFFLILDFTWLSKTFFISSGLLIITNIIILAIRSCYKYKLKDENKTFRYKLVWIWKHLCLIIAILIFVTILLLIYFFLKDCRPIIVTDTLKSPVHIEQKV
ncbi:MAG TPA: hypothetical protein VMW81_01770 [Nitrospinota bacterium]|nr:hypothetical protein [Nitrospinota bacterium]